MERTIIVKGIGKITANVDFIEIDIRLVSTNTDYEQTLQLADLQLHKLRADLSQIGFDKKEIKTISFNVETKYTNKRNDSDEYENVFLGYECRHELKLSFDFDMQHLSRTIQVLANSQSKPQFSIRFLVKDQEQLKLKVLEDATLNARNKAKTLANSSGVILGEIVSIQYHWNEINPYSNLRLGDRMLAAKTANFDIEPEEVEIRDEVTFVWNIQS